ncbi:MAG TPA: hypothetical protein PLU72_03820 [Candidatus Ozemobacteraceae bacterium]|nr:hypothetical protein [Candidatus Ozemobacteraceae bacterium]
MSFDRFAWARRGIALHLVLFLVLIISGLTLAFFQLTTQAQRTAFRLEQGEVLRQIVEAADEEAFASLDAAFENQAAAETRWVIGQGKNPGKLAIPVPLTTEVARGMVRARQELNLTVEARVVDFINQDYENIAYSKDPNEGVGRIELTTQCRLSDAGGETICRLVRRRDYKVAVVVTPRDANGARSAFAQGAALDYALLVRQGLQEFRETGGLMLNQNRVRITVDPVAGPAGKRGKIRFGGADGPGDAYVFLNLDESTKSLLPSCGSTIDVTNADCRVLFDLDTWMANELDYKIKEAKKQLGSNYSSAVDDYLAEELKKKFDRVKGKFEAGVALVPGEGPTDIATKIRSYLWNEEWRLQGGHTRDLPDRYDRPAPGFLLLGPDPAQVNSALAGEILEGGIRQRFLYHSALYLDISSLDKEKAKDILTKPWMGLNPPPQGLTAPADIRFYGELPKVDAAKGAGHLLFSRFDTSFPYGSIGAAINNPPTDAAFPIMPILNRRQAVISPDRTGPDGFRPYGGFGLWARRFDKAAFLRSGMYDPTAGKLHIDGIVQILGGRDSLIDLGSPERPLIVTGQGVLVAPGFQIRGEIRRSDPSRDLLVLLTRKGDIVIDTDKPVEASLIAAGDDLRRSVIARRPLNIIGAVVVDRLNTHFWCAGEHHLKYDAALQPAQPIYRPAIGRWVVFERLDEG